jgi:hypothetical protein
MIANYSVLYYFSQEVWSGGGFAIPKPRRIKK